MYAKGNEVLGRNDKLYLVHMRNLGYYLDRRWEADFVFERYTLEKVLAGASSAGDLTVFFRGRGVTYLMVNTAPLRARVGGLEAAERALFDEFLASRTDPVMISGDYGLYRLKKPVPNE